MRPRQTASINLNKIDESALIEGKNGKYLSICFFENKDGNVKFGNDGFITQEISKERRDSGEKGPIIGNFRYLTEPMPKVNSHNKSKANGFQPQDNEDNDIPF